MKNTPNKKPQPPKRGRKYWDRLVREQCKPPKPRTKTGKRGDYGTWEEGSKDV